MAYSGRFVRPSADPRISDFIGNGRSTKGDGYALIRLRTPVLGSGHTATTSIGTGYENAFLIFRPWNRSFVVLPVPLCERRGGRGFQTPGIAKRGSRVNASGRRSTVPSVSGVVPDGDLTSSAVGIDRTAPAGDIDAALPVRRVGKREIHARFPPSRTCGIPASAGRVYGIDFR